VADAQTRGSAPQIPHIIGYRRASSSASSITTAAGVSELKILEEARANEEIARNIFGLRTKAGLTTTASVICRLEERRSFKNPTLGQRPIPTKIVRSSNSGPTAGSIAPANK
jgi:hypothetical protein